MKTLFPILLFVAISTFAQTDPIIEVQKFQKELNEEYKDPIKSPLSPKARKRFKGHDFFPFDPSYRVEAELVITEATPFLKMPAFSMVKKEFRVYGKLKFQLKGKEFEVPVYQSQQLMGMEKYKNYLFFPFTDLTNGKETYDAGRYISLYIPKEGNTITLDFNQAYNPFCAYSDKYSCPVVPAENFLDIEIPAGVRHTHKKKK